MRTRFSLPIALAFAAALVAAPLRAAQQTQQQQNPPAQQQAQPQTQTQPDPAQQDSVADAARKAKGDKPKPATKKVFTDEDVSSLKSNTLSVVGEQPPEADANADPNAADAAKPGEKPAAQPGPKDEAYWRARAKKIRDQRADVDQQIASLQDEIKKGGNLGVDPKTGLGQNVIILEDRSAKLKSLEKKRDDLQAQMDALEEEARRADVPVGWLR